MFRRTVQLALALVLAPVFVSPVAAAPVSLELYPFTGEVRLANSTASPLSIIYYSLSAAAPAFNGSPAVWKSISDVYDVSGNGFIDPVNNWTKFATSSTMLVEGVFLNPGGSLPAFRALSLGKVWNGVTPVTAQVLHANSQFATVSTRMAIDGDYDQDGKVDAADYLVWKAAYGQSGTLAALRADGNLNGVVDAADYSIWRNNIGRQLLSSGQGSFAGDNGAGVVIGGTIVPEPAAVLLWSSGAIMALLPRRRRREARWCTRHE